MYKRQASDIPGSDRDVIANQTLSLNVQLNRDDLEDWVLIENMTEQPVVVREFSPRYVTYNQRVLDLNALLSRQQAGKNQLEIWPNFAWTHSVRGASRAQHPMRPQTAGNCSGVMNKDTRSMQLALQVDRNGTARLTG